MHSLFVAVHSFLVSFVMSTCDINNLYSDEVLWRPTEYLRNWILHSDGRHDACSNRELHSVGRHDVCSNRELHSVGRHNACSNRIEHSVGRHDAYSNRAKYSVGRHDACSNRKLHSVGRHNACSNRIEYSVGRHNVSAIGYCTLSAVTMLASDRKQSFFILSRNSATWRLEKYEIT